MKGLDPVFLRIGAAGTSLFSYRPSSLSNVCNPVRLAAHDRHSEADSGGRSRFRRRSNNYGLPETGA